MSVGCESVGGGEFELPVTVGVGGIAGTPVFDQFPGSDALVELATVGCQPVQVIFMSGQCHFFWFLVLVGFSGEGKSFDWDSKVETPLADRLSVSAEQIPRGFGIFLHI